MGAFKNFLSNLPEVKPPAQKHLSFKEKLKWTIICLVAFFVLSNIPLYGLDPAKTIQFEQLALILAASIGTLMTLGIGPIVTASIIMQLLNGSGLLKFDLSTHEGKKLFQGSQKFAAIIMIFVEGAIMVWLGGLSAQPGMSSLIIVFQLIIGGIIVMGMDEIVQKWGFGSGISLFIVAGVATELIVRAFSPLSTSGVWAFGSGQAPVGKVWVLIISLISRNPGEAVLAFSAIVATLVVLAMAVYAQAMKVEIPLSFGRIRGHGIRWPLKFLYTSNIPVILVAALLANIQLWAKVLESAGRPILGTFSGGVPVSGIVSWLFAPQLIDKLWAGSVTGLDIAQSLVYIVVMMIGALIFSLLWVQTSGMDAASQAKQMMSSGLQIPGFRKDVRVMEQLLKRYITPLTAMGGLAIGLLAAVADLLGALAAGTSILLSVMIIYQLYESIAQQHMVDMYPGLRKMMGG